MAILFEASGLMGKVVDIDINMKRVRWELQVVDGPHAGKRAAYSGKFDSKSIRFTKGDMRLVGWKTNDIRTFKDDVAKADPTVRFDAEIAEYDGRQWTSARLSRAVASPPLTADETTEMNSWLEEVPDEEPAAGSNKPGGSIPFAHCGIAYEPSPIASVLRRNV